MEEPGTDNLFQPSYLRCFLRKQQSTEPNLDERRLRPIHGLHSGPNIRELSAVRQSFLDQTPRQQTAYDSLNFWPSSRLCNINDEYVSAVPLTKARRLVGARVRHSHGTGGVRISRVRMPMTQRQVVEPRTIS